MRFLAAAAFFLTAAVAHAGSGWIVLAPVQTPRQEVAVAAASGRLYLIGGISAQRTILATVEEYDPVTNRWRFVAPLPRTLHHTAAATIGNSIYVIGGFASGAFDPVSTV